MCRVVVRLDRVAPGVACVDGGAATGVGGRDAGELDRIPLVLESSATECPTTIAPAAISNATAAAA